jgi:hypothetical protein
MENRISQFEATGVCLIPQPFTGAETARLGTITDEILTQKPGTRAFALPADAQGALTRIAAALADKPVRLVRILAFDKTPAQNWGVPWHQDRTMAVQARADVPGFGPWSVKAGTPHVEPPAALMEGMLVLRFHVDDCGLENSPLKIIPGSHKLGRVPAAEVLRLAACSEIVTCTAGTGDILAMKALTLHASEPAGAPGHRRVLHLDFAAAPILPPLEWAVGRDA